MGTKVTFGAWDWHCWSVQLVSFHIPLQSNRTGGLVFMSLWKPQLTNHLLLHLQINFLQSFAHLFLHGKNYEDEKIFFFVPFSLFASLIDCLMKCWKHRFKCNVFCLGYLLYKSESKFSIMTLVGLRRWACFQKVVRCFVYKAFCQISQFSFSTLCWSFKLEIYLLCWRSQIVQGTSLKFYVGVCNLTCLYISQFLSVLNVKESYSARNVINVGQVGG